ncbi:MAG: C45 family autoproteolytic acyltransferase/hydrolase [Planctomycetota bacterium]
MRMTPTAKLFAAAVLATFATSCSSPNANAASGSASLVRAAGSSGSSGGFVRTMPGLSGKLETLGGGLRVLRLWGTPEQRGYAHGFLMAEDACMIMRQEFGARFAQQPKLLEQARAALPRLIEYPEDVEAELKAMWRGLVEQGADRDMPKLGRAFDEIDLRVANALDVFGLMGCSSFTAWGEQVQGGGVLTARNFDWPLTGDHMLDQTLLIVQKYEDGRQSASISWPGYVGAVTGVSADGVAAYLHVGSAKFTMPQPSSWPSAVAARRILEGNGTGKARIQAAREALEYTSPPVGFMTHIVLPKPLPNGPPVAVFETNTKDVVRFDAEAAEPVVVTNHFRTREDGRPASPNSTGREQELQKGITGCFAVDDKVIDTDEAWRMLQSVEAGGGEYFGTLHSLVFRHDPWFFELRVGEHPKEGIRGAPSSVKRRYRLTREQVFGK